MKIILSFLLALSSISSMAQYPVTSISITLPPQPKPNTGDWAMPFVITAQAKLLNGQVPGYLTESRILVTIKKGGTKFCGSNTQTTAPVSMFNSPVKTWSGGVAIGLIGSNCVLPPGSYELCVQFFSNNPAVSVAMPYSSEVCKTFTIAEPQKITYSPPQNVMPVDGKVFTKQEANLPIMFRWTPVLPKPKEDVIYKVRLYEVAKGTSKAQAIKSGSPVETIEVKNITQTSFKLAPRCNNCEWVWNVEASKKSQLGEIEMLGTSEVTGFGVAKEGKGQGGPPPGTLRSQCDVDTKLQGYKCLGKDANGNLIYSVTTNFIVGATTAGAVTHFNDPNNIAAPYCSSNGPTASSKGNPCFFEVNGSGLNNVMLQNDMNASSGPFKATYSNGTFPTTYKIIVPAGTTQLIIGYYFYITPDNATCVPKDTINIDAPCPCDLCETLSWGESGNMATLSQDKNSTQISQAFSIPSIKIKQVTAEIIGFDWQVNDDCKKCLKETYGYFIGGTASGEQVPNTDASFPVVDGMPLLNGFELDWNLCGNKRPQPLNGTFKMDVALPPATSLSCCTDQFNICIRYTILTDDCRTCSKVICYPLSRMHGKEK